MSKWRHLVFTPVRKCSVAARCPKMSGEIAIGDYGTAEDLRYKQDWSFEGIIRKINIKTRQWRGNTIVQGFQVHTDSGFSHAYGMNYNEIQDVTDLQVPQGLQIQMVRVRSGVYVNSLAFVLSDGQVLGPVGGQDAGKEQDIGSRLTKDGRVFFLSGISGSCVTSYKAPCICRLSLKFTPKQ